MYKNYKKFLSALRKKLLNRETKFSLFVRYQLYSEYLTSLDYFDDVYAIDDKKISTDADYLEYSIGQVQTSASYNYSTCTITYQVEYDDTLKQEKALTKKLSKILASLKLDGLSNYNKIKKIHDYVVNHMRYDQTYSKYSAYHAVYDKEGVCEAYSLLMYRLLNDAGIPCIIVDGTGNGGSHAWNAVKLKGKWYFVDATWDDPVMSDGSDVCRYTYFLKCYDDMEGHVIPGFEEGTSKWSNYKWSDKSYK